MDKLKMINTRNFKVKCWFCVSQMEVNGHTNGFIGSLNHAMDWGTERAKCSMKLLNYRYDWPFILILSFFFFVFLFFASSLLSSISHWIMCVHVCALTISPVWSVRYGVQFKCNFSKSIHATDVCIHFLCVRCKYVHI